jgi:hypothetical protein
MHTPTLLLLLDPAWSSKQASQPCGDSPRWQRERERDVMKRFGHVRLGNSTAAAQLYALHSTVLALACCGAARASSSELSSNGSQRHRDRRQRGHQAASHATYVRTGSSAPVARAPSVRPSVPIPVPCNDPARRLAQQVGAGAARSRREKREPEPAKQRGSSATFSPPGPARVVVDGSVGRAPM